MWIYPANVTAKGDTGKLARVQPETAAMWRPATERGPARVCVVAEIGVNHDGSLERALELVAAAAESGADAVKLQLFDPHHLLSADAALARYQADEGEQDVFAMLQRLQLDADEIAAVQAYAAQRDLAFLVTPFSIEEVAVLREIPLDAVKIASPDAVNLPLLERAASLGKPMIISTGTCELDELVDAASYVRATGGAMLQCISSYPADDVEAAIGGMAAMAQTFRIPVGYSDHTTDPNTGALAVAAGACVIEKHFTYSRAAPGPDHAASFEPAQFAEYVRRIRQAEIMLGPIAKRLGPSEAEVRQLSRQSLVARHNLPAGHVLTADDLLIKRPGTGIPAAEFDQLIGQRLVKPVRANTLLHWRDLSAAASDARATA